MSDRGKDGKEQPESCNTVPDFEACAGRGPLPGSDGLLGTELRWICTRDGRSLAARRSAWAAAAQVPGTVTIAEQSLAMSSRASESLPGAELCKTQCTHSAKHRARELHQRSPNESARWTLKVCISVGGTVELEPSAYKYKLATRLM